MNDTNINCFLIWKDFLYLFTYIRGANTLEITQKLHFYVGKAGEREDTNDAMFLLMLNG